MLFICFESVGTLLAKVKTGLEMADFSRFSSAGLPKGAGDTSLVPGCLLGLLLDQSLGSLPAGSRGQKWPVAWLSWASWKQRWAPGGSRTPGTCMQSDGLQTGGTSTYAMPLPPLRIPDTVFMINEILSCVNNSLKQMISFPCYLTPSWSESLKNLMYLICVFLAEF